MQMKKNRAEFRNYLQTFDNLKKTSALTRFSWLNAEFENLRQEIRRTSCVQIFRKERVDIEEYQRVSAEEPARQRILRELTIRREELQKGPIQMALEAYEAEETRRNIAAPEALQPRPGTANSSDNEENIAEDIEETKDEFFDFSSLENSEIDA